MWPTQVLDRSSQHRFGPTWPNKRASGQCSLIPVQFLFLLGRGGIKISGFLSKTAPRTARSKTRTALSQDCGTAPFQDCPFPRTTLSQDRPPSPLTALPPRQPFPRTTQISNMCFRSLRVFSWNRWWCLKRWACQKCTFWGFLGHLVRAPNGVIWWGWPEPSTRNPDNPKPFFSPNNACV